MASDPTIANIANNSTQGTDLVPSQELPRTLSEVFLNHNGNVSDKWEQDLGIYEAELVRFLIVGEPVNLLEIGVQNGGSLQVWSKYLPAGSRIVGIDIDPRCKELTLGRNVQVLLADAGKPADLERVLGDSGFDIIIDDGSHRSSHVITAFKACFQRLKPGGVYIIEDLHCSYFSSFGGSFRGF